MTLKEKFSSYVKYKMYKGLNNIKTELEWFGAKKVQFLD